MHKRPILTLIVGLSLWACGDPADPAGPAGPTGGTMASIHVAVTTTGLDPDQDGYQLTIDGVDALALNPMGTVQ